MNLFDDISTPRFRPAINMGAGFDIPSGLYERGIHGESILNGGLAQLTGIGARPNNYKSALALHFILMARRNHRRISGLVYDSEGTLPASHLNNQAFHDPYLSTIDFTHDTQLRITDVSVYNGDEVWERFRKNIKKKTEKGIEDSLIFTTPFLDQTTQQPRKAMYPTEALFDSLSKMIITGVENMYDKNTIGSSANNTDAMTLGKAKNQMLNQIPQLAARSNTYIIMTALLGDVINMEMYPTDKRALSMMPKDTSFKGVSSTFYSLPHNLYLIIKNTPLQTKDKTPEYPRNSDDNLVGDTDLAELTVRNIRPKNGIAGIPFTLVVSQSEGLLVGLTEFHNCKRHDRFGIGGNLQNYYMELCPDVKLSRTKVRHKVESDERLKRAISITSDMLQIQQYHRLTDKHLICTPKELYDDLIAKGYDWDVLLNTRSYWVFVEEEGDHEKPFLSTMDLLRMRVGEYVPYWFTDEQKAKLKL